MSGISFRYNQDKAGTSGLGTTTFNDIDDNIACCKKCYDVCGWMGVALLAIAAVGVAYLAAGSDPSCVAKAAENCFEWCTYDNAGFGTCFKFLCSN